MSENFGKSDLGSHVIVAISAYAKSALRSILGLVSHPAAALLISALALTATVIFGLYSARLATEEAQRQALLRVREAWQLMRLENESLRELSTSYECPPSESDCQRAKILLDEALARSPQSAEPYLALSFLITDPARALIHAERSAELSSGNNLAMIRTCLLKRRAGSFDLPKTESCLHSISERSPSYAPIWIHLGLLALEDKRADEGLSLIEEGVALSGREPAYREVYLSSLFSERRLDEIVAVFYPGFVPEDDIFAPLQYASALLALGHHDSALGYMKRVYRRSEQDTPAQLAYVEFMNLYAATTEDTNYDAASLMNDFIETFGELDPVLEEVIGPMLITFLPEKQEIEEFISTQPPSCLSETFGALALLSLGPEEVSLHELSQSFETARGRCRGENPEQTCLLLSFEIDLGLRHIRYGHWAEGLTRVESGFASGCAPDKAVQFLRDVWMVYIGIRDDEASHLPLSSKQQQVRRLVQVAESAFFKSPRSPSEVAEFRQTKGDLFFSVRDRRRAFREFERVYKVIYNQPPTSNSVIQARIDLARSYQKLRRCDRALQVLAPLHRTLALWGISEISKTSRRKFAASAMVEVAQTHASCGKYRVATQISEPALAFLRDSTLQVEDGITLYEKIAEVNYTIGGPLSALPIIDEGLSVYTDDSCLQMHRYLLKRESETDQHHPLWYAQDAAMRDNRHRHLDSTQLERSAPAPAEQLD